MLSYAFDSVMDLCVFQLQMCNAPIKWILVPKPWNIDGKQVYEALVLLIFVGIVTAYFIKDVFGPCFCCAHSYLEIITCWARTMRHSL